jgi:hypothetical protein
LARLAVGTVVRLDVVNFVRYDLTVQGHESDLRSAGAEVDAECEI